MTFKLKLIFVSVFFIVVTVAVSGFLGYRESKWKIKDLARELLVSKTEQAFALCDRHYKNLLDPSAELKAEIASLRIARDGYISVISNAEARKGELLVHPTNVGMRLYNDEFPHIKAILDEIDAADGYSGYANFTYYRQGTVAKGRQGERKIGYFMYFAPWRWVILATGYEKDVFASRDQLRATLYQLVVPVMLLAVLTTYIVIMHIFRPVQRLTESTREVAKGNWDISIDYSSKDEIGVLAQSFNKMVQSLRENARIWHEFNVARDMQAQMLPTESPTSEWFDISARSIPTTEVGGDFYDFLHLEEGRLGLVVGDVSGHGVSAAMVMTAAMSAVRFAAEEKSATDGVMSMVNARLSKDIQSHMFVALFYGVFDARQRKLYYTNAGQTMPFLWRQGKVEFLPQAVESDRFPLGIVATARYEQLEIDLQPGDILVFYTDGIVDAMNGTYETYGFDRLRNAISKLAHQGSDEMLQNLVIDMQKYSGNNNAEDDVTLVIVRIC